MKIADPIVSNFARVALINLYQDKKRQHDKGFVGGSYDDLIEKIYANEIRSETMHLMVMNNYSDKEIDSMITSKQWFQEWKRNRGLPNKAPTWQELNKAIEDRQNVANYPENKEWDMTSEWTTPLPLLKDIKVYCICVGEPFTDRHAKWVYKWAPLFPDMLPENMYQLAKQYANRENISQLRHGNTNQTYTKDLDNYLFSLASDPRLRSVMGIHLAITMPMEFDTDRANFQEPMANTSHFLSFFGQQENERYWHEMDPLSFVLRKHVVSGQYTYRSPTGELVATSFMGHLSDRARMTIDSFTREQKLLACYVITQMFTDQDSRWRHIPPSELVEHIITILEWCRGYSFTGESDTWLPQHIYNEFNVRSFTNYESGYIPSQMKYILTHLA